MSTTESPLTRKDLRTRSEELHSVVISAQVTDASGERLETDASIVQMLDVLSELRRRGGSLYLVGNGGSAAIAGHAVTDFLNVGGLRAMTLHDSSLMTCMANDYGYENGFARVLSTLATQGDVLIAISSSGKSKNICNAAARVCELGGTVITLSGFTPDNPLRALGHFNIWLDSRDYGMVEIGHQFVLHNLSDRLPPREESR